MDAEGRASLGGSKLRKVSTPFVRVYRNGGVIAVSRGAGNAFGGIGRNILDIQGEFSILLVTSEPASVVEGGQADELAELNQLRWSQAHVTSCLAAMDVSPQRFFQS